MRHRHPQPWGVQRSRVGGKGDECREFGTCEVRTGHRVEESQPATASRNCYLAEVWAGNSETEAFSHAGATGS